MQGLGAPAWQPAWEGCGCGCGGGGACAARASMRPVRWRHLCDPRAGGGGGARACSKRRDERRARRRATSWREGGE
eukprot:495496-Prymnesium_polylepis.1